MNTKETAKQLLAQLDSLRKEVEKLTALEPILKAAAEGKTIQLCSTTGEWKDSFKLSFDFGINWYRVKPNVVKTKRYWYQGSNGLTVGVYTYGVSGYPHGFEAWIDSEWSEVEVPE